jgi:hypothetical protein
MFRSRGIGRDKEPVVFHCNEGVHAAFDRFAAATILGCENAKIGDVSMSDGAEDESLLLILGARIGSSMLFVAQHPMIPENGPPVDQLLT